MTLFGEVHPIGAKVMASRQQTLWDWASESAQHNLDEIRRLDARIGDRVLVERAGDVIPKVVQVLSGERDGREREFEMPEACPVCESPVERDEVPAWRLPDQRRGVSIGRHPSACKRFGESVAVSDPEHPLDGRKSRCPDL